MSLILYHFYQENPERLSHKRSKVYSSWRRFPLKRQDPIYFSPFYYLQAIFSFDQNPHEKSNINILLSSKNLSPNFTSPFSQMTITLTLDKSHGFAMLPLALIAIQCFATSLIPGSLRKKIFTKEYMQKNFAEQHKKTFGDSCPRNGYPDMGNGRFCEKLDYAQWYEFNNAQRVHYNYVEQIGVLVAMMILGAVSFPIVTGCIGWMYFVGRVLYTLGYASKGPNRRFVGAITLNLSAILLMATGLVSSLKVLFFN